MAAVVKGPQKWSMTRDGNGHRIYKIVHLVKCNKEEGPATVIQASGLPVPGSYWDFDDDVDVWAFCRQEAEVEPAKENQPNRYFTVTQTFSTQPNRKCYESQFDDPLLEPMKISGGNNRSRKEATHDRDGRKITSSSHEQFRGPQVEFDWSMPSVKVEQNVADLELDLLASMVDTVNDRVLWGFPARCIKFSNYTWDELYYGQCYKYYKRILEFDISYQLVIDEGSGDTTTGSGFDRDILDEGTKVLNGRWNPINGHWELVPIGGQVPRKENPQHFIRFKDRNGENARVILDGNGLPADIDGTPTGTGAGGPPGFIHVEYYDESNLLLLGIPSAIG